MTQREGGPGSSEQPADAGLASGEPADEDLTEEEAAEEAAEPLNDEAVLGAAAGMGPGANDEGSVLGQQSFRPTHGMLNQRRRGQIPMKLGRGADALRV